MTGGDDPDLAHFRVSAAAQLRQPASSDSGLRTELVAPTDQIRNQIGLLRTNHRRASGGVSKLINKANKGQKGQWDRATGTLTLIYAIICESVIDVDELSWAVNGLPRGALDNGLILQKIKFKTCMLAYEVGNSDLWFDMD